LLLCRLERTPCLRGTACLLACQQPLFTPTDSARAGARDQVKTVHAVGTTPNELCVRAISASLPRCAVLVHSRGGAVFSSLKCTSRVSTVANIHIAHGRTHRGVRCCTKDSALYNSRAPAAPTPATSKICPKAHCHASCAPRWQADFTCLALSNSARGGSTSISKMRPALSGMPHAGKPLAP